MDLETDKTINMEWFKKKPKLHLVTNTPALKNLDFNNLPILSAKEIIDLLGLDTRLKSIKLLTGAGTEHYNLLYLPAIENYIESVQLAPGSASHHHSGPGGLITHTLDVIDISLRKRKSYNLPLQCEPELISKQEHIWTYGVFAGALLHDIGKLVCSTRLILNTGASWSPHDISILKTGATHYKVVFVKSKYKLHTQLSNGFFHLLPAKGRGWLAQYTDVMAQLTAWLSGDVYEYGVIGEIVRQSDGESVAKNLKIGGERQRFPNAPSLPLVERLTTALRQLLEEGRLKINRPDGSAGWSDGDYTYLVCGSVADSVRSFMNNAGANDIPTDNSRIFDTWQEHGFIISTPDNGSIWHLTVNNKFTLTVLKFETNTLFHPSRKPEIFAGELVISSQKPTKETKDRTDEIESKESQDAVYQDVQKSSDNLGQIESPESVTPCNTDTEQAHSNGAIMQTSISDSEPSYADQQTVAPDQIKPDTSPVKNIYMGNDKSKTETDSFEIEPTMASSAIHSTAPDTLALDDPDIAQYFLEWLKQGIKDKSISVNNKEALIHVVKEGILIVSPKAFKSFAKTFKLVDYEELDNKHKAETKAATKIQNKLEKYMKKLKLHRKAKNGKNIHTYLIQGQHRESKINGWLIPLNSIYDEKNAPKPNNVLTNISGFKEK